MNCVSAIFLGLALFDRWNWAIALEIMAGDPRSSEELTILKPVESELLFRAELAGEPDVATHTFDRFFQASGWCRACAERRLRWTSSLGIERVLARLLPSDDADGLHEYSKLYIHESQDLGQTASVKLMRLT